MGSAEGPDLAVYQSRCSGGRSFRPVASDPLHPTWVNLLEPLLTLSALCRSRAGQTPHKTLTRLRREQETSHRAGCFSRHFSTVWVLDSGDRDSPTCFFFINSSRSSSACAASLSSTLVENSSI